ncbi:outer membrane protein assembly factor BamD [Catenovulum sp. 2E275]|uniref:outer membrane protein assembly factor BamD n=1 Tax=Catenovulum sp. 2E275 TaxID=2980497 RepID=UPI0021CE78A2|nr:outer membrane protein assembly factor BamD [Catenovulum sp. 2E275]MCU4675702.1 outer membrane protein assembly factor BamD [Catenovulum sp. 2E275]
MNLKQTIIASSLALSVLAGCSSAPDEIVVAEQSAVESQYLEAKDLLIQGNYVRAAEILSALDASFPFGPYSHQIQLDLIYSYYKTDNTSQALASIDRFLKLNPTHTDIDYVYYMRGLTNLKAAQNALQEMVGIDRFDRDITEHRDAFNDFNTIVTQYPQSQYAKDARQRMIFAKNFIAKSELAVAEYYMRRSAYVAAANRAKYVLENLGDTDQVERALEMMLVSYDQLELKDLYNNTYQVLKLNYPDNSLVN